ncbi:MAG: hypothetical protein V4622_02435 [Bacteroidota bacterium]
MKMNKDIIYKLTIISGLIPATILLLLTIIGISNIFSFHEIRFKEFIVFTSMILGIVGYVGLLTSLIFNNKTILNLILLLLGLIGFVIFTSFEGGLYAWKWIITMEEPEEWFIPVWPNVVSLIGIVVNSFKIIKKAKNEQKHTFPNHRLG